MDDIERDTILAALRFWQSRDYERTEFLDIATNGGTHPLMTDEDIDDLCERINCGDFDDVDGG